MSNKDDEMPGTAVGAIAAGTAPLGATSALTLLLCLVKPWWEWIGRSGETAEAQSFS